VLQAQVCPCRQQTNHGELVGVVAGFFGVRINIDDWNAVGPKTSAQMEKKGDELRVSKRLPKVSIDLIGMISLVIIAIPKSLSQVTVGPQQYFGPKVLIL
jgi:hypothetical protein